VILYIQTIIQDMLSFQMKIGIAIDIY